MPTDAPIPPVATAISEANVRERLDALPLHVQKLLNAALATYMDLRGRQERAERELCDARTPRDEVFMRGRIFAYKEMADYFQWQQPGLSFEDEAQAIFKWWVARAKRRAIALDIEGPR